MVGAGDMVGTRDVIVLASSNGGCSVAASVMVHEAQREQAEVGLVSQVDEAQVRVVGLG